MDHLQIIADALRLVIEQSHIGSDYHVNSKDDGGTRHVAESRNDVAIYLARTIRVDRQSVALRQTLDQQQIDLLEDKLAHRQEKLDWFGSRIETLERDIIDPMDFKGLPNP